MKAKDGCPTCGFEAMAHLNLKSRNSVRKLEKCGVFHPITDKDGRTKLIPRAEVQAVAQWRKVLGRRRPTARGMTADQFAAIMIEALKQDSHYRERVYGAASKAFRAIDDEAKEELERQKYEREFEARAERRLRELLEDVPDLAFNDLDRALSPRARRSRF